MLELNDPAWLLQIIKRYSAARGADCLGTPNIIHNNNATGSPEYIVVISDDNEPRALRVPMTEETYQERRYDEFGASLLRAIAKSKEMKPKCSDCGVEMKLDESAPTMSERTGTKVLYNCPACGTGRFVALDPQITV